MLSIRSCQIASWPHSLLCHRDFDRCNICKVKTWNGFELEIVFDQWGYPLLDQSLLSRMQEYYRKKFIPIKIDGELAFANIVRRKMLNDVGKQKVA